MPPANKGHYVSFHSHMFPPFHLPHGGSCVVFSLLLVYYEYFNALSEITKGKLTEVSLSTLAVGKQRTLTEVLSGHSR